MSAQLLPRLWSELHFKYADPAVMNGQSINVDVGLRLPENTIVTRANWRSEDLVVGMGVWWNIYQGNGRGLINELRPYVGKPVRRGDFIVYPRLGARYFMAAPETSQFHGRLAVQRWDSRWQYELWYQAPLNIAEHRFAYRFNKRPSAPDWLPDLMVPMLHWSPAGQTFWTIQSEWRM